jgi:flagellar biosynthesis/type III secretory pathway M-ring protein FliF/YscJ
VSPIIWVVIIVVAIIILVAIIRSMSRKDVDVRKREKGLSFGTLDRALQKDTIHRDAGEFTIAMDLSEVDMLIESGDYDIAEERVREFLKEAEDKRDTLKIANMMGYLEKIELAKKRRF